MRPLGSLNRTTCFTVCTSASNAIEQQATHLRREVDGEGKTYVGSLFSNALQSAASRLVTTFGASDEGVREFFHENPVYDDKFGQKLAGGIGDVGATLAMMYSTSFVGAKAASALGAAEKGQKIAAGVSSVTTSTLSNAMIRYKEGFAEYQRVLDAQQALFGQQQRHSANRGQSVRSLVSLYRALGGGWQTDEREFVDAETRAVMTERTNWGDLLPPDPDAP